MEVLASRILLHPVDMERSLVFYRDVLGLAIAREFPGGTVFHLGGGFLELSGGGRAEAAGDGAVGDGAVGDGAAGDGVALWMQVRDLDAAHRELAEHVTREPRREPWGLSEMWLADPDGRSIVLVEVPADHPMRRDPRW